MTNSYYTLSPLKSPFIGRWYYRQCSVDNAKALRDKGLSRIVIREGSAMVLQFCNSRVQVVFPLRHTPFQLLPHFSNPHRKNTLKVCSLFNFLFPTFFPPFSLKHSPNDLRNLSFHWHLFCQDCQWLPHCQVRWQSLVSRIWLSWWHYSWIRSLLLPGYHILLGTSYWLAVPTQFLSLLSPLNLIFKCWPWPQGFVLGTLFSSLAKRYFFQSRGLKYLSRLDLEPELQLIF